MQAVCTKDIAVKLYLVCLSLTFVLEKLTVSCITWMYTRIRQLVLGQNLAHYRHIYHIWGEHTGKRKEKSTAFQSYIFSHQKKTTLQFTLKVRNSLPPTFLIKMNEYYPLIFSLFGGNYSFAFFCAFVSLNTSNCTFLTAWVLWWDVDFIWYKY